MPAKMLTATESAKPWASAIPTKPAPLLIGSDVATIAAMPAKHKKNVPSASAKSCLNVYIDRYLPCNEEKMRDEGQGIRDAGSILHLSSLILHRCLQRALQ